MTHLGWFFAGASLGLFLGALVMCLARVSQAAAEVEQQAYFRSTPQPERSRLIIMRR